MSGCVYRSEDNKCKFWSDYGKGIVTYCDPCDCKEKTTTNANRIRAMTDEELAEFLWNRDIQIVERASKAAGFNYYYDEAQCIQNISDWLKTPVEVDNGT